MFLSNGLFDIVLRIESSLSDEVVRLDLQEGSYHVFVDFHDYPQIIKITVVCSCENRHEIAPREELVPVLLNLMGTTDKVDVVLLVEVADHHLAKGIGDASIILAPIYDVFLRISRVGPKQITKEAAVGHVCGSQNFIDLLQLIELR